MTVIVYRCSQCGLWKSSASKPLDHYRPRMDGWSSLVCGPFETWEARKL